MTIDKSPVPIERIGSSILLIRGQKIMSDNDLASIYDVPVEALNQPVKRSSERFPEDFIFRLTMDEARTWWNAIASSRLRSQIMTLKRGAHNKCRPFAFTEHGILMLPCVLKSNRAVQVNILIMCTFIKMREMLSSNVELNRRLHALDEKNDEQFKFFFDAMRRILMPPSKPKRPIGFQERELALRYAAGKRKSK